MKLRGADDEPVVWTGVRSWSDGSRSDTKVPGMDSCGDGLVTTAGVEGGLGVICRGCPLPCVS